MSAHYLREKSKWKEREDAWLKIENLAKSNPQVRENAPQYGHRVEVFLKLHHRVTHPSNPTLRTMLKNADLLPGRDLAEFP